MSIYTLQQVLEKIGLSEKEAGVYLANLEVGHSPASTIAKRARLNRCTTYNILEKLVKKGLIALFIKNNMRFYCPAEPSRIVKNLREQKNEIEEQLEELENRLYEFERIKNKKTSAPKISLLEGTRSITNLYNDIKSSNQKLLTITSAVKSEFAAGPPKKLLKLKHLKAPLELSIYDGRIAIILKRERIGIIIENAEIAEMHREIFGILWGARRHRSIRLIPKKERRELPRPRA